MRKILAIVAALLAIPAIGTAQDSQRPKAGPMYRMVQCGFMELFRAKLDATLVIAGDSSKLASISAAQSSAVQCARHELEGALDAAKGNDDVRNALKDYFTKFEANTWALLPQAGESTRGYEARCTVNNTALDEKLSRLKLEWSLAKLEE